LTYLLINLSHLGIPQKLISSGGIVIRMAVADISTQSRATRGVTIMNLEDGDTVAAIARIPE